LFSRSRCERKNRQGFLKVHIKWRSTRR